MNIYTIWKRILSDFKNYTIAIIFIIIWNIIIRTLFHAFCPSLIITGIPCAGCGMTRAVFCILTGQITRGMFLNPAAPFWIAWIIYFFVNRYIYGKNVKWVMRLLGVVCVITIGIYFYRIMTQFPGNPPMTYYRNNLLSKYGINLSEMLQCVKRLW